MLLPFRPAAMAAGWFLLALPASAIGGCGEASGDGPLPGDPTPPVLVREGPEDLPRTGCFAEPGDGAQDGVDEPALPLGYRVLGLEGHALIGVRRNGDRLRLHRFFLGRGPAPVALEVYPSADRLLAIALREGAVAFEVEAVLVAPDGVRLRREWLAGLVPPPPWGGLDQEGRGHLTWPERSVDGLPVFTVFDADGRARDLPPGLAPVAAPGADGRMPVQRPLGADGGDDGFELAGFFDPATEEISPLRFEAAVWSGHGPDGQALYAFSSGGTWARVLERADGQVDVASLGVPATQELAWRGQEPRYVAFGDGRPQALVDTRADQLIPLSFEEAGVDARLRSSGLDDQGPWYLLSRGSVPLERARLGDAGGAALAPVDPDALGLPTALGPLEGRCSESNGITDDGRIALFLLDEDAQEGGVWLEPTPAGGDWARLGRPFVDPDFVRMRFADGRFLFFAGNDASCRFPWTSEALSRDDDGLLRGGHVQVGVRPAEGPPRTTWSREIQRESVGRGVGPRVRGTRDLACVLLREPSFLFDPEGSLASGLEAVLVDVASGATLPLDGLRETALF
ncbi:MAG TPA: hypothetical protein RMF84_05370 [Polyangiaceae bacterium LLY-WYZ-14_1]|nr:hypothetical protein [Polyangiaceae bacterium LLY-WYZ-14_1]